MAKCIKILVILAGIFSITHSQQTSFLKFYGPNYCGYDIQRTKDGGYIITGRISSGISNSDVCLIKVTMDGNTVWTKTYGGSFEEHGCSVQQTIDNGFVVAGGVDRTYEHIYLLKTDANGDTIWTKSLKKYGVRLFIYDVIETADSNYIFCGSSGDAVYLLKTDANGDTIWTKTYSDPSGFIVAYSLTNYQENEYMFVGHKSIAPGDSDYVYLGSFDDQGDMLWTRTFNNIHSTLGRSLGRKILRNKNGFIITGEFFNYKYGSAKPEHILLMQINMSGDTVWVRDLGSGDGFDVIQTSDGGYIICGIMGNPYFQEPCKSVLIKTDKNGELIWRRTYDDVFEDENMPLGIVEAENGGYVITGWAYVEREGLLYSDMFLMKTDENGEVVLEGLDPVSLLIPNKVTLFQNYPNPFNSSTKISFFLPYVCKISLSILNIRGEEVTNLTKGLFLQGYHELIFDGGDLPSGVYFLSLKGYDILEIKKILLLK